MTHPWNTKLAGVVFACVVSAIPAATLAQGFDTAPSGSFTFGGFGTAQADNLPVQLSEDSTLTVVPQSPTTVTELGTTSVIAEVQPIRIQPRRIQNTWSIGVFR